MPAELDVLANDQNVGNTPFLTVVTQPSRGTVATLNNGSPAARLLWADNGSGAGPKTSDANMLADRPRPQLGHVNPSGTCMTGPRTTRRQRSTTSRAYTASRSGTGARGAFHPKITATSET
jgi:hypothetical protein